MSAIKTENMTDEQKQELFSAMLGQEAATIEDLPEVVTFPKGTYTLLGSSAKINIEKMRITFICSLINVIEAAEGDDIPLPAEGSLAAVGFSNIAGLQRAKKVLLPLMQQLGVSSYNELIDRWEGLQLLATLSHNLYDGKYFQQLEAIMLDPSA